MLILIKPRHNTANSLTKRDFMPPAECMKFAHAHEFARCAVRLRCVPRDSALKADNFGNEFGERFNTEVFACADIQKFPSVVLLHKKNHRIGGIVRVQKLTER